MKNSELNEKFIESCIDGAQRRASAALAAGAHIAYRSLKTGVTGFHCAARGGHQALAKQPLELGSDINTRDRYGCTPLFDLVSDDDDVATAKFLLDHGADVDAANNDGWTPLMVACTWGERPLEGLTRLKLDHPYPTALSTGSLRAAPKLPRLATLTFSCAGPGLGPALAPATVPLRALTLLDVNLFTDSDALAIANSKDLSRLERLTIRSTRLRARLGLTARGRDAWLSRLTTFSIDDESRFG